MKKCLSAFIMCIGLLSAQSYSADPVRAIKVRTLDGQESLIPYAQAQTIPLLKTTLNAREQYNFNGDATTSIMVNAIATKQILMTILSCIYTINTPSAGTLEHHISAGTVSLDSELLDVLNGLHFLGYEENHVIYVPLLSHVLELVKDNRFTFENLPDHFVQIILNNKRLLQKLIRTTTICETDFVAIVQQALVLQVDATCIKALAQQMADYLNDGTWTYRTLDPALINSNALMMQLRQCNLSWKVIVDIMQSNPNHLHATSLVEQLVAYVCAGRVKLQDLPTAITRNPSFITKLSQQPLSASVVGDCLSLAIELYDYLAIGKLINQALQHMEQGNLRFVDLPHNVQHDNYARSIFIRHAAGPQNIGAYMKIVLQEGNHYSFGILLEKALEYFKQGKLKMRHLGSLATNPAVLIPLKNLARDYFIQHRQILDRSLDIGTFVLNDFYRPHSTVNGRLDGLRLSSLSGINELQFANHKGMLDLSGNCLQNSSFFAGWNQHLGWAEHVYLAYNNVSALYPGFARQFPRLKTLKLQGNAIKDIPFAAVESATLERLDLSDNDIEHVPTDVVSLLKRYMPSLKELKLSGNPFTPTTASFKAIVQDAAQKGITIKYTLSWQYKFMQMMKAIKNKISLTLTTAKNKTLVAFKKLKSAFLRKGNLKSSFPVKK